jgi:hypothetical protein
MGIINSSQRVIRVEGKGSWRSYGLISYSIKLKVMNRGQEMQSQFTIINGVVNFTDF